MPPYKEQFPLGSPVRVRPLEVLLEFQRTWKYHHPVSDEMLVFAGRTSIVSDVGFYHGGDVLYQLDGIQATWHEACLEAQT